MNALCRLAIALVGATALALPGGASGAGSQEGPVGTIAFEGSDGLYLVDAAGGSARRIPGTRPRDGDPAWSPDGLRIVFDRGGDDRDIWVMDVDGANQHRLTFAPGDDGWPRWAPHGRAVTFESDRDRRRDPAAYVVHVGSGQARRVAPGGQFPDWRSDGRILFQGEDFDVESVLPYGGGRTVEARETSARRFAVRPSDDGERISFTAGRPPRSLYTARTDGTGARLVYSGGQEIYNPAWSPDDAWLTFSMGAGNRLDVYVIRADGSGLRRLTRVPRGGTACCSDWAP